MSAAVGAAARGLAAAVLACAVALAATGCGADAEVPQQFAPNKWGYGDVITDFDLMVERVPALVDAREIAYTGGPTVEPDGPRELPTPDMVYWIDAVVTLREGGGEQLRNSFRALSDSAAPDVVAPLDGELTDGPWLVGPGLASVYTGEGWSVVPYLDADDDTLVLLMVDGPLQATAPLAETEPTGTEPTPSP